MSYFSHAGCQLHYQEYGHGEPLLLLHGLGSSCQDWELQMPVLASRYRVIALDLRGHGRSDKPREAYSIAGFAVDVAALIEHLQLEQVHLVGLSMGGMVGFQLAVDQPQLLASLTIVNSSPEVKVNNLHSAMEIGKRWLLSLPLSMRALGRVIGKRLFPLPGQHGLRQKIEERWALNNKRAYLASLRAITGWSVREDLGLIQCPVLVISADMDYTPVTHKAAYVREIPDARLQVIRQSRHFTPLDQPQAFNSALLDFLTRHPIKDL